MSDLGDEFVAAAHKVGLILVDEDVTPEITQAASEYLDDVEKHCPALQHVASDAGQYTLRILRRQHRALSGVPFSSNEDALDKMREVITHLAPVYMYFFTLGVDLGEKDATDPEEIQRASDAGRSIAIQMKTILWMTEPKVMTSISGFMYGVFNTMAEKVSFNSLPAEIAAPKVWDLCWFSSKVTFQQVFCVGWEVGANRRVMAELKAIAEVSGGLDVPE